MTRRGVSWVVVAVVAPIALVVICGGGVLAVLSLVPSTVVVEDFDPEAQPWEAVSVPLPEPHGVLTFEQRSAHPRFAEYHRRVSVGGAQLDLPFQPGGRTHFTVRWHEAVAGRGPFVALAEADGTHVVDLTGTPSRWALCEREGRAFLAASDCGWVSTPDGWQPTGEAEPSPLGPGRVLGAIEGRAGTLRFDPAPP